LLALKELNLAREALVKDRTAATNHSKVLTASLLKRQNTQRLEQIDRQTAAIEAAILERIRADPDLAQRFAILTAFRACRPSPPSPSMKCPSSAPSMQAKRQVSPASCQSPSSPARWTGHAFIREAEPSHLPASPRCNPLQS
jgi:transposase